MCYAMREKLAELLRGSVRATAHTANSDKLHNGGIANVLVFPDQGSTRESGLVWRGCSAGRDAEGGAAGALDDGSLNPGDKLEGSDAAPDDPVHLKRRVGLFSGVALIVGTMIGSGIFVSPSGLLERTGSVGISFIIWMACGLLSLLGALAYAELGTMNTSSGAEYAYFMDAFGAPPAFLFSWVSTLVLKPSQMAIICLSFAKYAVEPFVSECEPPGSLVKLVAVISIVMILAVNCYSVNLATNVQNIFTAAKLGAIAIIVCGGAYKLILGNTRHLQEPNFASSTATLGNIANAFYTGLWAYDGWNNLNYVTEEIKNPSKNLPLSIIIGIPLVTLCYALVNVSYLAVMSVNEMTDSEAVAVTFGNRLLGPMAWLMPLAVTISTFGSANGTLFVAGRLCFAASREGHLLDILSYVHVRRFTPAPGLIFHSLIAVTMVLYGTIDSLIDFFSFTAWIFYGGAMLALIVMRYTKPDAPRPYKVPIVIPYAVLLVSAYLVVAPIVDKPQWEYLYATAFIFAGLLFYLPFVKWGYSLPFMGALAYAELGTMNTSSGAEYAYFMDAFGAPPAFLFSWVSTLVLKPSQMAIICLSFAKYAVEPFVSECEPPGSLVKLVAVISIVMILAVNCYSVNLATNVQNIFTAAKLGAIAIIVCGGAYKLILGNTRHLQEPNFASSTATLGNIANAFYTGLWAYDGWNNLNYVTEEIKNPSKNLPLSIIIGIPLVTLCYALVNVSYLAVMSVNEMTDSEAVAVTFGNRLLGPMAWLMPLAVTISTFGSANGTLFVAGRLCFAASREGHLLDILSYVHVRRFTPAPGLIFHSLIAVTMVLYGTIDSLIDFFSFTAWIFYGGAMLALIVMRYTKPDAPRPYKVPIVIPYAVLLVSAYLVVAPIVDKPQWEYLYATAFIFAGLLFYLPFVKWGYSLPFMDKITVFLQMVLEVVPTSTTFEY